MKGGDLRDIRETEGKAGNFLLPHLAQLKGSGAAAKMTREVQSLVGKVDSLPDNVDGTSFRSGAIQTMATHPTTSLFELAVRSGHHQDMSVGCRALEYTWCLAKVTLVGGQTLGGYLDSQKQCYTARLIFLRELTFEQQTKMENLINHLFASDINFGSATKQLYHCLFATLLMSLQDMATTYGFSNCIVHEVITISRKFHFSYLELVDFGTAVRKDFLLRNLAHTPSPLAIPAVSSKIPNYLQLPNHPTPPFSL